MDSTDQLSQCHVVTDAEADFEPSGNFKHLCQLNMEISLDNFTNTAINWETFSGKFTSIYSNIGVRRGWGGWVCLWCLIPPPEIPKALQNRAKLNPIVKTVKNC